VLRFDRDLAAIEQARAMHLADRCAGDRLVVPLGEQAIDRGAELRFDQLPDRLRRRRGRGRPQAFERLLVGFAMRLRHDAVYVARHLPDLGR
jgi:hypothetical protein